MTSARAFRSADRMFLYSCAVGSPKEWEGQSDSLRDIDPAGWDSIKKLAVEHGFLGLIARNLAWAKERTGISAPILPALESMRRGQLVQQLVQRAAARRVMEALEARHIEFIVFKGLVAAEEIYGDLSLRSFRDLDIMVRSGQVTEACSVALEMGYTLRDFKHVQDYVRNGRQAAQMSHADGTSVDLHWTLTFDLSTKEQMDLIWEGCRSSGENRALPGSRLSHEMTLIHFATHFQHHDYQEFKPLLDFHTAARVLGEKVIASDLICRAERLRLLPAVRMAARLCKLHFSSSGLIDTLTTPKSTARERLACRFLTADRLLRAENYSRRSDWLSRFFFSATPELSLRSLRKLLMPRPGELEILFARPFDVLMYPKYYGRRLQQALTATKQAF